MKKLLIFLSAVLLCGWSYGQQAVTGTVTDTEGEALIGVNILEEGTTNGTITDLDGTYSLEVEDAESILIFSFTGMET
ncbi:MAG: hypothetical protein HKN76_14945, partial [Saprospiraceae bacterium]|nr:hypothetical protein [Saprospiraceae bacterium]